MMVMMVMMMCVSVHSDDDVMVLCMQMFPTALLVSEQGLLKQVFPRLLLLRLTDSV